MNKSADRERTAVSVWRLPHSPAAETLDCISSLQSMTAEQPVSQSNRAQRDCEELAEESVYRFRIRDADHSKQVWLKPVARLAYITFSLKWCRLAVAIAITSSTFVLQVVGVVRKVNGRPPTSTPWSHGAKKYCGIKLKIGSIYYLVCLTKRGKFHICNISRVVRR